MALTREYARAAHRLGNPAHRDILYRLHWFWSVPFSADVLDRVSRMISATGRGLKGGPVTLILPGTKNERCGMSKLVKGSDGLASDTSKQPAPCFSRNFETSTRISMMCRSTGSLMTRWQNGSPRGHTRAREANLTTSYALFAFNMGGAAPGKLLLEPVHTIDHASARLRTRCTLCGRRQDEDIASRLFQHPI